MKNSPTSPTDATPIGAPASSAVLARPKLPSLVNEASTPEQLRPVRRLQLIAGSVALLWLAVSISLCYAYINKKFIQEVEDQYHKALSEATFIAQIVEKELHYAEQLAITLSHEADIISHLKDANDQQRFFRDMPVESRKSYLEDQAATQTVNALFSRLVNDVDLMSVFLLDADANCISSSYVTVGEQGEQKGCIGSNYQTRHYYLQAREQGHGRQFAVGRNVPLPSLFFSRASTLNDQFIGAVVVRLSAQKLTEALNILDSTTWVVDRLGVIIDSTHEPSIYSHVGSAVQARPSPIEIKNIYAKDALETLPVAPTLSYPNLTYLQEFNGVPQVIARVDVTGQDFEVWHALDIEQAELLARQGEYLAIAIISLGLLIIVIAERASDYHQRSLANFDRLAQANLSLEKASNELYTIAITDHLTQISTRGYFLQRLEQELERSHREGCSFYLLQLDIDYFKHINDTYGHAAGDIVIRKMAHLCREAIRDSDLLGRMGGEEFAVGLIECNRLKAENIAETIRRACEHAVVIYGSEKIRFTCSIGIASLADGQSANDLLVVADKALYAAKKAGRNRIQCDVA